jgi:hypothetical protein
LDNGVIGLVNQLIQVSFDIHFLYQLRIKYMYFHVWRNDSSIATSIRKQSIVLNVLRIHNAIAFMYITKPYLHVQCTLFTCSSKYDTVFGSWERNTRVILDYIYPRNITRINLMWKYLDNMMHSTWHVSVWKSLYQFVD